MKEFKELASKMTDHFARMKGQQKTDPVKAARLVTDTLGVEAFTSLLTWILRDCELQSELLDQRLSRGELLLSLAVLRLIRRAIRKVV